MNTVDAIAELALPEVREVTPSQVEEELLNSSRFCDLVWLLLGDPSDNSVLNA